VRAICQMARILIWVPSVAAGSLSVAEGGVGPARDLPVPQDCVLSSAGFPGVLIPSGNWRSILAGSAAVFGPLDVSEAERVARLLRRGGDPRTCGTPDVPWALVLRREDGVTLAAASTMLQSGLFYTQREVPELQLLVATNPGALVSGAPTPRELDKDFVRSQAAMTVDARRTPFTGISRLPPGSTLCWRDDLGTQEVDWLTPDTLDPPTLRGDRAISRFRQSIDSVLSDSLPRSGTLVAQMSGGWTPLLWWPPSRGSQTPTIRCTPWSTHQCRRRHVGPRVSGTQTTARSRWQWRVPIRTR